MIAQVYGPEVLLILPVILAAYFAPSIVAYARHHQQSGSVLVINLFLGWTFIGWIVALAMAVSATKGQNDPS